MRRLLRSLTLALSLLCPVTLPVRAHQSTAASQDPQTQTFYITKTGKKYHRDGCRYLASSSIAISLKDAKTRGTWRVSFAGRRSSARPQSSCLVSPKLENYAAYLEATKRAGSPLPCAAEQLKRKQPETEVARADRQAKPGVILLDRQ